jgi:hypothetical protein
MKEFVMTSGLYPVQLKNRIFAGALVLILAWVLALPTQVYAKDAPGAIPTLDKFVESLKDGSTTLRGVYVSNVMALAVVQQPTGRAAYVSTADSVATQFSFAAEVGNVGLLAHNTHAGRVFTDIKHGYRITLVYGDGRTESFIVKSIQRYQALDPLNPYSYFKDLDAKTSLSAEELFNKVYRGDYHLTLQTCIENNGNSSWGRLFILATPVESSTLPVVKY